MSELIFNYWTCDNCDFYHSTNDEGQSERMDLMHKPEEF